MPPTEKDTTASSKGGQQTHKQSKEDARYERYTNTRVLLPKQQSTRPDQSEATGALSAELSTLRRSKKTGTRPPSQVSGELTQTGIASGESEPFEGYNQIDKSVIGKVFDRQKGKQT
jgi:hypothetical protein